MSNTRSAPITGDSGRVAGRVTSTLPMPTDVPAARFDKGSEERPGFEKFGVPGMGGDLITLLIKDKK